MLRKHIIERSSRDRQNRAAKRGTKKTYADVRKVKKKKQKYPEVFTIQLNKIY